ncbi:probable E3 ubiquitin-protein ligase XERICO [Magnolia sinica]|uniref:probable E3 ubiquitin-protein ligase XERICO n=1 Tax=Magnolia sinica TaxID=86752 RepID=UPI002657C27A|nr:probable E3 ubiquitin-protein ligase XERICO [Magnolia sinica]
MGLSSMPTPSEGVLSVLLVNTALSITIFKEIVRSILHVVGIRLPSPPPSADISETPSEPLEFPPFTDEFRCRVPSIRFGSCFRCPSDHDCSVCLTRFEPDSEINRLPCGHFFHKGCLEKWLEYWNTTCPLCRTPVVQEEDASCPWF